GTTSTTGPLGCGWRPAGHKILQAAFWVLRGEGEYICGRLRVRLRRAQAPGAVLHQPRPAGVRLAEPARGGQGRAVLALLEDREEPAAGAARRVHQRAGFRLRPPRGNTAVRRRHGGGAPRRGVLRARPGRIWRLLGGRARRRPRRPP